VSGTLTHAADLLLCAPMPSGGRGEVLAYQFRDTAGGEVRTGRRWEPPILVALSEAMATIEARVGTNPVNLAAGRQIQIEDYPLVAVREAIANGLTHGEHRDRRPVLVEHSPELLQVHSPGPLVSGISPSNILTHPPKPRFPSLAEAMRACGLGEKWGKGIDRMYREMIRSGRSAPVVQVSEGDTAETTVRFTGGPPNVRIAKFIASLPAEEQDDTDTLLVVAALATKRNLNAEQLAPLVQRDVDAAQSVLTRLANGRAELVEPTPRSARRRYPDYRLRSQAIAALGPALAYQSRPRADSDQKISAHVREYGSIDNAAVQRMLDVDIYAARDVLRDLVDRGGRCAHFGAEPRHGREVWPGAEVPARARRPPVTALNETTVESAALDYLRQLGWSTAFGPSIAPDSPGAERSSYEHVPRTEPRRQRLGSDARRVEPGQVRVHQKPQSPAGG